MTVDATLAEREKTYGDFTEVARISQNLKDVLEDGPSFALMPPFQREALHMICSKLARMVCGDPKFKDTAHDISGYAKLVEDRL